LPIAGGAGSSPECTISRMRQTGKRKVCTLQGAFNVNLTPVGPKHFYWQHRDFGHLTMNRNFNFFLWNFHTIFSQGVALRPHNFHNFWLHGFKFIVWYVVFSVQRATQVANKNSLKIALKVNKNSKLILKIHIYMERFESFHLDQWIKSYEEF